ncbi:uncharacterized protein BDV14DRAFT_179335 [Aspergillus stella-maris]|uniref:uncharacterized protein n=1 Tax=Aspergillus stella-maris TaxID=1810926 RepID=UPI003CCD8F34
MAFGRFPKAAARLGVGLGVVLLVCAGPRSRELISLSLRSPASSGFKNALIGFMFLFKSLSIRGVGGVNDAVVVDSDES